MVFTQSSLSVLPCCYGMAFTSSLEPEPPRFPEMPSCAALSFERLQRYCPQSWSWLRNGHPESWNLILDRWWWNPWWRCGTMGILIFFLSKTKRAEFREQTDLLCFFVFDSRCSGAMWFSPFLTLWVLEAAMSRAVKLDTIAYNAWALMCFLEKVRLVRMGKDTIASMPRWGSHGFLWTWKQMADFNEIVEQGPRGRTWQ